MKSKYQINRLNKQIRELQQEIQESEEEISAAKSRAERISFEVVKTEKLVQNEIAKKLLLIKRREKRIKELKSADLRQIFSKPINFLETKSKPVRQKLGLKGKIILPRIEKKTVSSSGQEASIGLLFILVALSPLAFAFYFQSNVKNSSNFLAESAIKTLAVKTEVYNKMSEINPILKNDDTQVEIRNDYLVTDFPRQSSGNTDIRLRAKNEGNKINQFVYRYLNHGETETLNDQIKVKGASISSIKRSGPNGKNVNLALNNSISLIFKSSDNKVEQKLKINSADAFLNLERPSIQLQLDPSYQYEVQNNQINVFDQSDTIKTIPSFVINNSYAKDKNCNLSNVQFEMNNNVLALVLDANFVKDAEYPIYLDLNITTPARGE